MRSLGKTSKGYIVICLGVLCVAGYFLFTHYFSRDTTKDTSAVQGSIINEEKALAQSLSMDKKTEQELLHILYTERWLSEGYPRWLQDFNEGIIRLGIYEREIEELWTFEVIEIDAKERSIVIRITGVEYVSDLDVDDDLNESRELDYLDRIILEDNKLIYEFKYDHPEDRRVSTWIAE